MPIERRLMVPRVLRGLDIVAPWVAAVARDSGWTDRVSFAIQLCLEEALANIVEHDRDSDVGPITIVIDNADLERVSVRIESAGKPFDPTLYPEPVVAQSLSEAEVGGQGIHLMRHFASSMRYERCGKGNSIELTFDRIQ